jgi:hypothetical protein
VETFRADLYCKELNSTLHPDSTLMCPLWTPLNIEHEPSTYSHESCVLNDNVTSSSGGGVTPLLDLAPDSSAGGGSESSLPDSASSPAGMTGHFPNERYNRKGQRLRFGDKPAELGSTSTWHWTNCKNQSLEEVSDSDLSEYLIGHSAEFLLPQNYWPNDKGRWLVSCVDSVMVTGNDKKGSRTKKGNISMKVVLMDGPRRAQIGLLTEIQMSGPQSIRNALKEARPDVINVQDIIVKPPAPATRSRLVGLISQLGAAAASIAGGRDRGIQID